jgi:uncharacterized protein YbaR (Trm112 family)
VKRLLVLVAAAAGGAWWLRRRTVASEASFEGGASFAAEPLNEAPPALGGDVDPELLAILACPVDKAPVKREGNYLVCESCRRHYPIRDGIPVMLIDEALTPDQAAPSS